MTQPRFYPPSDSSPFSFLNTKWSQIFLKGIRKHKPCLLCILQEKPLRLSEKVALDMKAILRPLTLNPSLAWIRFSVEQEIIEQSQ